MPFQENSCYDFPRSCWNLTCDHRLFRIGGSILLRGVILGSHFFICFYHSRPEYHCSFAHFVVPKWLMYLFQNCCSHVCFWELVTSHLANHSGLWISVQSLWCPELEPAHLQWSGQNTKLDCNLLMYHGVTSLPILWSRGIAT